jgi:hypothetical protein
MLMLTVLPIGGLLVQNGVIINWSLSNHLGISSIANLVTFQNDVQASKLSFLKKIFQNDCLSATFSKLGEKFSLFFHLFFVCSFLKHLPPIYNLDKLDS